MIRHLKRYVYQWPVMAPWRARRAERLSQRFRDHPLGFRFAGRDTFFRADWEPQERAAIVDALARADVFIDVGANEGIYTCIAAAGGVAVCAVEPEAGNLRYLLSNVQENGFERVEVFPLAIAEGPRIARFYGDGVIASLAPEWHRWRKSFFQLTPVNSLDNLFADRWSGERLLVKIDVEGGEIDAIRGAARLIARTPKPTWIVEAFLFNRDDARSLNQDFGLLFSTMFAAGYACTRVDNGMAVTPVDVAAWLSHPHEAQLGLSNFLFHA